MNGTVIVTALRSGRMKPGLKRFFLMNEKMSARSATNRIDATDSPSGRS